MKRVLFRLQKVSFLQNVTLVFPFSRISLIYPFFLIFVSFPLFAHSLSLLDLASSTFRSWRCKKPHVLGVARGPFKATVFFLTLAIALSGMTVRPSFRIGVTSTSSHEIGAYYFQLYILARDMESLAHLGSFEDLFNTLCDLLTDTISWNQSDHVVALSY